MRYPEVNEQTAQALLLYLQQHRDDMVLDVANLVAIDSPSDDLGALAAAQEQIEAWIIERLGNPDSIERLVTDQVGQATTYRFGESTAPFVALLGHYDTVWPLHTPHQWEFKIDADTMTGPGVFDMKTGLVQAVWAIKAIQHVEQYTPPIVFFLNGDEETGSRVSGEFLKSQVAGAVAALVFEGSIEAKVKTARKGIGRFTVTVTGIEAHAGLDPTIGASAIHALGELIPQIVQIANLEAGTSVNIGTIAAGSRPNVSAGKAVLEVEARTFAQDEHARINTAIAALMVTDERINIEISGGWHRPPFERTAAVGDLFALTQSVGAAMGLEIAEAAVGGASDGNLVAALGIPVIDGMGSVGSGAHARSENASIQGMIEHSALAAGLIFTLSTHS